MISVVIPTLNEEANIAKNIKSLKRCEVIVSDGGSKDNTVKIARKLGAKVVKSPKGRARQMNTGAKKAKGDIILFLHADTLLPKGALKKIDEIKKTDIVAGGFCMKFTEKNTLLGMIAAKSNFRILKSKLIFGDQAMFVKRKVFNELGGFKNIKMMEDVDFSKRLIKNYGRKRIKIIKEKVITSGRRFLEKGIIRLYFKMGVIRVLYFFGVHPNKLVRLYR